MNSVKLPAFSIVISLFLMGCPYKEIYKFQGNDISEKELRIYPVVFYYGKQKDGSYCTAGLRISNLTQQPLILNFNNSHLLAGNNSIPVKNVIYRLGKLLDPKTNLVIPPATDTIIALLFKNIPSSYKGDINLALSTKDTNNIINYKRIRKLN
jgi:hypothetical protein